MKLRRQISAKEFTLVLRQLATLLTAGVPLVQCLEITASSHVSIRLQTILNSMKRELEAGNTFSSCLRKLPDYFDAFSYHLVQIGELSGTLDRCLTQLAQHKEKTLALKRKLQQALIYPSIITVVATIITIMMLVCIVPRFEELFQSNHATLPTFTLIVIHLSQFLRHESIWIIGFMFLIGIGWMYTKRSILPFFLKIPFIHQTYHKLILARFSHSLALLTTSGAPLLEALKITLSLSRSPVYIKTMTKLHLQISAGRALHVAMASDPFFPPYLTQMVKVGEESGHFAQMLEKVAELNEADVDSLVNTISHLLEPLIIIILGVLIGALVVALYLPIFQLGTVI